MERDLIKYSPNERVPLRYDTKAINSAVPIRQVLERYAGINTNVKGFTNVQCPSPSHTDKKPSAHIYDQRGQNHCTCFSCNTNFTPITVVMLNTGKNLPDACQTLIDDYGLSMSSFTNIDEVERSVLDKIERKAPFPLTVEDCHTLNIAEPYETKVINPNYEEEAQIYDDAKPFFVRPSLLQMWENDKENTANMLLGICEERISSNNDIIKGEQVRFNVIYSLHNEKEWGEAKLLEKAADKYKIGLFSKIRLTDKQRQYIEDIKELYSIAEHIAECEETRDNILLIKDKITNNDLNNEKEILNNVEHKSSPNIER